MHTSCYAHLQCPFTMLIVERRRTRLCRRSWRPMTKTRAPEQQRRRRRIHRRQRRYRRRRPPHYSAVAAATKAAALVAERIRAERAVGSGPVAGAHSATRPIHPPADFLGPGPWAPQTRSAVSAPAAFSVLQAGAVPGGQVPMAHLPAMSGIAVRTATDYCGRAARVPKRGACRGCGCGLRSPRTRGGSSWR